jgi:membrane dipeptidase
MIDGMHQMCAERSEDFALCLTATDAREAVGAGKVAVIMTIEGQSMFEEHVEQVRNWHRLGVRVYSLTHGEGTENVPGALQVSKSHFGHMPAAERDALRKRQQGLTDFARASLHQMGRLGIACDLAHANDVTFWEVMEHATGPVCATHANCAALCPHTRNLTDEMLKALAEKGGVLGICFYAPFTHETDRTLDRLIGHAMHALEVMGEDHVGVGTDFDGGGPPEDLILKDPSQMNQFWEALDKKGVPNSTLVKIAHDNFLRLVGD